MSLHMEESSPLTDSKMDISDATTSVDSIGVSPVKEEEVDSVGENGATYSPSQHSSDNHTLVTEKNNLNKNVLVESIPRLDNRITRPVALALDMTTQKSQIERTLANSHPLMSPPGTDSDSEQGQLQLLSTTENQKCHNFPDVVPHSERLHQSPTNNAITARNKLNIIRGKYTPTHHKLNALRAHSPDLLSSESDADISQYHAAVEANFQTVALVANATNDTMSKVKQNHGPKSGAARINGVCDDISSLDSISNHSFDNDEEHNLASLSPSSSIIDGLDDDDDDDDDCEGPELLPDVFDDDLMDDITPTAAGMNALPQYTAADERRDSRNWQKITLPDGKVREIDMRVIEPYKRVLSHGGYLKAGGHNAIVIFCACHLPDRSRADYSYVMDNLFLYVIKTLEQLVTDDYVLIYLHGGTSRRNVPPFPWMKRCYQLLDRRLRKSLKNMYLVHPTFWIKSIVWMARPFVSTKFWRKLVYVKSLAELSTHVAVEKAAIPEKVKQYDAKHN